MSTSTIAAPVCWHNWRVSLSFYSLTKRFP